MDNKKKAIMMMLISAFGFSVMAIFVRLAGDVPAVQKSIFRSFTIMIISGIVFWRSGEKIRDIKNPKLLLLRVITGTIGIVLNYYAIDNLILSDANVIFRVSSVIILFLSYFFLKEELNLIQIAMALLAFSGVVVISKPSFSSEFFPYLVAIIGAFVASIAYTSIRAMKGQTKAKTIVFAFSTFTTVVLAPYVMLNFVPMPAISWFYLIMAGCCAAVGQYGLTLAYQYAPASEISIYNYYGLVFTAILGIIFLGEYPPLSSLFGYVLIFVSSLVLFKYGSPNSNK